MLGGSWLFAAAPLKVVATFASVAQKYINTCGVTTLTPSLFTDHVVDNEIFYHDELVDVVPFFYSRQMVRLPSHHTRILRQPLRIFRRG